MDRQLLSKIAEDLVSSEVAALCYLCSDIVGKKNLEAIKDATALFLRLEEKGVMGNYSFLSQLLHTIRRADLLSLLETDSSQIEETDASPVLSDYRVMLYQLYEDLNKENFGKLKFLMSSKLGKRPIDNCKTALDVFTEMEKTRILSSSYLNELYEVLLQLDQQLASTVRKYMDGAPQHYQTRSTSRFSMDYQRAPNSSQDTQPTISISETQPGRQNVHPNAEPNPHSSALSDQTKYYNLSHIPRGLCVVINNEEFEGPTLKNRLGTEQDEKALSRVFNLLGFTVVVHNNLTSVKIRNEIKKLGTRNFMDDDALVVCVLSHGEKGCVYGTDENPVYLRELTQTFTSERVPTLAGKPKLFFIQACQGSAYQGGAIPCPPTLRQEKVGVSHLEADAGPVEGETVASDADFLVGMATVEECKSFRNTSTGSIYIQELCTQLLRSAQSPGNDDILAVLTRVNNEVSKGVFLKHKQMPQPKYTLTKTLILKCVRLE